MSKLGMLGALDGLGKGVSEYGKQKGSFIQQEWIRNANRQDRLEEINLNHTNALARDSSQAAIRAAEQTAQNTFTTDQQTAQNQWQSSQNAADRGMDAARLHFQAANVAIEGDRIRAMTRQIEGAIDLNKLSLEDAQMLRDFRNRAINEQDPEAQRQLFDMYDRLRGDSPASRYTPVQVDEFDDYGNKTGESIYSFDKETSNFNPYRQSLDTPPGGGGPDPLVAEIDAARQSGVPDNVLRSRLLQQGVSTEQLRRLGL